MATLPQATGGAGVPVTSPPSILKRRPSRAGRITWDEPTIAEHDKERGTRMPIVEPKTPYHAARRPDDASDSDGLSPRGEPVLEEGWAEVQAKLGGVAAAEAADGKHDSDDDDLDLEPTPADFRAHRKAHYGGEAEAMRRARELLAAEESDEDDSDDGDLQM